MSCTTQQVTHTRSVVSTLTQIPLPEPLETDGDLRVAAEASAAAASRSDCFTQRNSLFHQEVLQVTFGAVCCQVVTATLKTESDICPFLLLSCLVSAPHFNNKRRRVVNHSKNENTFKASYLRM